MIHFKPLSKNDLELLYHWFKEPTINHWYARDKQWSMADIQDKYLGRIQGKDNIPSYIIYLQDQPVGFIQYYCLDEYFPEGILDYNNDLFKTYRSSQLAGIDIFLAYETARGKGLGVQVIAAFMLKLPLNTRAVLVDPLVNNINAIRCYEKADFKHTDFSKNKDYVVLIKHLADQL